jgi:hypothetical protein
VYICEDCGKLVEEEPCEVEHCSLSDEFPDYTVPQKTPIECSCGGEFVEAVQCKNCGEYFANDYISICQSCRDDYRNLDTVLEIGSDWENKISLNGFLMTVFTKEDIELILLDTLKNFGEDKVKEAVDKYCEDDIDYFWRHAEKKWKEEKSSI